MLMGAADLERLGTVILLTGPSSVGKTSIAVRLRMTLDRPTIFLNGDDLDLPEESQARRFLLSLPPGEVPGMEAQFLRGFFGALASFAGSGLHCIGEMLFKSERDFAMFREQTGHVPTLVVHLRCDDPIRLAREAQRHDRPAGIAELTGSQEWIPATADLAIDTTRVDASQAAALIAEQLHSSSLL
jgi:chloramphenicol 3-O-phosphotransferase